MTRHPLDRPLALGEPIDTSEADTDFLMRSQPEQTR
jgi:hypothetical protein